MLAQSDSNDIRLAFIKLLSQIFSDYFIFGVISCSLILLSISINPKIPMKNKPSLKF